MLPNFTHKKEAIRGDVMTMVEIIRQTFAATFEAIERGDTAKIGMTHETQLGHLNYLANSVDNNVVVALALHAPEAGELRELIALLKSTSNVMRIGSAAKGYAKRMKEVYDSGLDVSVLLPFFMQLHKIVLGSMDQLLACLHDFDVERYRAISIEEEKSDEIAALIQQEIFERITDNATSAPYYFKVLSSARKLERAMDQLQATAHLLMYAKEGGKVEFN